MLAERDILLREGAFLLAPCPHSGPCPLQSPDRCHFSCRVSRSRLHRMLKGGEAPYEDEKFTYLIFSRTPGTPTGRIIRRAQRLPGRQARMIPQQRSRRSFPGTDLRGRFLLKTPCRMTGNRNNKECAVFWLINRILSVFSID